MSFYVTTPIYYVNAAPHLGHAYTTIAADVLARHHRQRGEDVFFLTGTDEHGEPVADAAHALGISPQELADRNAERFRALAPELEATNDFFIRTTDDEHEAVVRDVLSRVRDGGYVYEGTYEGWYCPRCADFKADNEIDEGNRCPIHHIELTREQEENYFFALSAFQARLEELYAERPDFVAPTARFNEALSFIRSGLRDVPLTRHKLTWGVSVPWDETHVFYVWFDALLNYYSALSYAPAPAGVEPGPDGLTSVMWPASYHLIAKDILRFHAVFWPALLMAAEIELPRRLFVHGYLLMDGEKMSKSLGNVLDPFAVIERYGADALRFYLLREVPFGRDGSVSTTSFELRYETELANELGNLASRTLGMLARYRDSAVPAAALDPVLARDFAGLREQVQEQLDAAELTAGLEEIWRRVRRLNRYVEECAPWTLAKDPERAGELDTVLASLVDGLRVVAVLLWPYIPASSERLLGALGSSPASLADAELGAATATRAGPLESLFPKEPA
ncbi:MAG TPA: class I tRNA ligase family protein [Solirubrobacteraceae bacterium]|jgi:methionyl-tRNA synthetase|nr:class I tRNA ligase family protein [Solirubrobacteraceae bacterium]